MEEGYKNITDQFNSWRKHDWTKSIPLTEKQISIISRFIPCKSVDYNYYRGGALIQKDESIYTIYQFPNEWFYVAIRYDSTIDASKKLIYECDQFDGLIECIRDIKSGKI